MTDYLVVSGAYCDVVMLKLTAFLFHTQSGLPDLETIDVKYSRKYGSLIQNVASPTLLCLVPPIILNP